MIVTDTIFDKALPLTGRAKYQALATAIRDGIVSGQLAAGAKLPPVRDLAYRVGVTPGTVARAYALLTEEGRLVAEVGRGTYVAGAHQMADTNADDLIYPIDDAFADFRSSRVPDVGQGLGIDAAFVKLGQTHRRRHINYPTAQTDQPARDAVATWIPAARIGEITGENIVLGNGAQNCAILALQSVLRGTNPVILTEELGYPGVRHAARLLRAKVVGLPMDQDGIIPEALAAACREHGAQVLLTQAEVHSPTTTHTSLARKRELAAIAEKASLTIIEDDCFGTVGTETPTYRMLLPAQCFYVSSLTKSFSGALRFGYLVAPLGQEKALRQVAQSSFYGVAQPISDVVHDLLTSGFAAEMRARVTAKIASRVRSAVNILGGYDIHWREAAPFVWLQMPLGWRASGFAMACERRNIKVRPADEFALSDGMAPNAVRLSVTTCVSEPMFETALAEMRTLLANPNQLVEN